MSSNKQPNRPSLCFFVCLGVASSSRLPYHSVFLAFVFAKIWSKTPTCTIPLSPYISAKRERTYRPVGETTGDKEPIWFFLLLLCEHIYHTTPFYTNFGPVRVRKKHFCPLFPMCVPTVVHTLVSSIKFPFSISIPYCTIVSKSGWLVGWLHPASEMRVSTPVGP